MRLPAEKVKEAILHPDRQVREAAVYYFSKSHSSDPTVMPLAIVAFERYGLDAFEIYSFMSDLVQTNDTVAWLIREIERVRTPKGDREEAYVDALIYALRHADARVLKQFEDAIHSMEHLDIAWKREIDTPIFISSFTFDELWRDLLELDEDEDKDEDKDEDEAADEAADGDSYDIGRTVADALAKFPEQAAQNVLAVLSDVNQQGWLEFMAVRLAGSLRLEATVPRLVRCLSDFDTWTSEEARSALVRIGTDAVVQETVTKLGKGDWDHRLTAYCLLEDIHTDLSVETCLKLLDDEQDPQLRGHLLQSILMNFSSEGIELARLHILATPKNPDALEVRSDLLVCCKMLDMTFPEFDEWLEDSKQDVKFRRQWYKDHPLNLDDLMEEFQDDIEDDLDEDEVYERLEPIVRQGNRVGRNEPCPCGSGKKYKKCCYGKDGANAGADDGDSNIMGSFAGGQRIEQFPIGTLAFYGPDDKTTTKIVAGVIKRDGAAPILERWVGTNIKDSPKVKRQIQTFFQRHQARNVVASEGNMGCSHEEGMDFPVGQDCPFCPYWAGKQGSNRRD